MAPPGPWHVSRRRIRAGAGLIAFSTAIQLWSIEGAGATVWPLGASLWLLVQPWRRRVMIFAVVVTTLWTALLALGVASELVGQSKPILALQLVAFVFGGVGLAVLPFAEVWAVVLAGILRVAAGTTLYIGLASTIFGGAHFLGVTGNASRGVYPSYDFRLASMLLLGVTMVFAGVLCLTAVRGLNRGQRRAWDRGVIGSTLLLLVTAPITPLPVQGEQAAFLAFPALLNLIPLVAAQRRLEAA